MNGVPPTAEQRLAAREVAGGRVMMRQRWRDLLFLHWRTGADEIRRRLPEGLHVDTFGGLAWIGVVPFFMERIRPAGLPPVPWLSWFLELNVRTYVHDDDGRPGVWFFSLDCNQPLAVEFARNVFHLPYRHASMNAIRSGARVSFRSRRRGQPGVAGFSYGQAAGATPAEQGTLEWFLVERYFLFSEDRCGKVYSGQVKHAPYRIARAECGEWSMEPLRLNGLPLPEHPPDSMLVAEPVDVAVYPLRPVRKNLP